MHRLRIPLLLWLCAALSVQLASAQRPQCAQLAPATTKAFLSIPDAQRLEQQFNKSQFGALVRDPALKPFAEDVRRQLEEKLSQMDTRLGITWEDLNQVASGEAAIAVIQPGNQLEKHAVAVLADVTGREVATAQLLKKIGLEMKRRRAVTSDFRSGDVVITRHEIPPGKGESRSTLSLHCVVNDWLLAADDASELQQMIVRAGVPGGGALSSVEAYATIVPRVEVEENKSPDIAWFIEPFGYAATLRAASTKSRRGRDVMGILNQEGFGAIKGIGGAVNFSDKEMHVVHRSLVLADSDGAQPALTRAARVVQLRNQTGAVPPAWIPADVATCLSIHFDIQGAFPHVGKLVDALENDAGLWDSVLDGLKNDRKGPKLDVENDLIRFMGERVLMVTRPHAPVGVDSEHRLYAFETTDQAGLERAFGPALDRDPTFIAIQVPGLQEKIWRHLPKERRRRGGGNGGNPFAAAVNNAAPRKPAGALAIANGSLMYATNEQLLVEFLKAQGDPLAADEQFAVVEQQLQQLGAGDDCLRYFTRMSDSQRVNYELMRQGKMPQAKSILGEILNIALAPDEPGVERTQQIDAAKLPPYPAVEKYLGNGGVYARMVPDGWSVTGFFLRKK